jgi:class 3 adenylate cyclase
MLELYFRKKDRRNFEKFFESFQQLQSIFGNTPLYRVVFNKGKGILSLFYHDFASAENNLKKALKHSLSSENPYPLEEARINGLLYLLYQELGDYNTSSSYYKKAEDFFNTYHLETDKKYYLTRQWDLSATDGSVSRGSTSRGSVKENMAYENILKSTAIITSIRDPKKILIKLTDILFQTFGAEKIHFCLDMEGKRYTLTSDKNLKTIEPEFVAKNLAEKAVKEGNFIIFQNLQKSHPEFEPEKSVLIFPIIRKGTPSGYLYLSNPILPGVFSGEDIKILTALMNQGLIAIENAIHFINEQNARARAEATMKAFRLFVPTQFLDIVASEGIDKIRLGNAIRKKVSILFSDIRDFTSISEKMSAEELMIFLNSYMDVIVGKNVENGKGFIDKFIGDAVMAVFDQSSSDRAMETAVNIQKSLVEYNHILKSQGMVPVSMGVGLNMGEVIMGTVGTQSRMDSTLIGDEVNLASRLESLTKLYGIGIIVSASTIKNLEKPDNFYFREIDSVTVKGKSIPVTIYEVFDWEPEEVREMKKTYESELLMGISFYKIREFGEAKNYFEMCQARNRQDPVVNVYLQRCEKYMVNPPDEDWNGAIQLDKK